MSPSLYSVSGSLQDYVDVESEYSDIGIVLHLREIGVIGYSKGQVA